MKKVILVIFFIVALAGGYHVVTRYLALNLEIYAGEIQPVKRGDLVVPITASGNIKPASVTQIKSKASGEVIGIFVELGETVTKGQRLIELLDVDERRNVDQAQASYEQAVIARDTEKTTLERRLPSAVKRAEANLEQARAQADIAKSRYDYYYEKRPRAGYESPITMEDWTQMESAWKSAQATVMAADADLEDAQTALELGRLAVRRAEEAVKSTQAALSDAKERLSETRINSPVDGMVLDKKVQIGEVVQSGKTMFTGGTVLMEIADVNEIYAVVNVDEADIGQVRALAHDLPEQSPATRPAASQVSSVEAGESGADPAPELTTPPPGLTEGLPVTVTVETFPDEEFLGEIARISPQSEVQQAVATFRVWVRIASENGVKLKKLLNTQAEARFTVQSVRNALLVSYDAYQKEPNGERYGVYVPEVDPATRRVKPRFVPCKFGADNGIDVEVKSGLQDGDKVYTKLPQKTKQEQAEEEKNTG